MPFSPIQEGKHHVQYSDIPGEALSPGGLKAGEMAFNVADGKMYMRAAGGNLLTLDGTVYPDRDSGDMTIASAYATNVLHPLVSSVTPVVEQTAVDGSDGALLNFGRGYAMSETIVGLSRTLAGGERTICLFDITTETIVREVVVGTSGTIGFTYDPWNKLFVGRLENQPTKALDANGNEFTFPASATTPASAPAGKGLSPTVGGGDSINYKTGEVVAGTESLGVRWTDGGGYSVASGSIKLIGPDGVLVSSIPWTVPANGDYQTGLSINGDFTKILTRDIFPLTPTGAMLDPLTGESTMSTASPATGQAFPSLKDAGVGEFNSSGIRYFDENAVVSGYTALTGDPLTQPSLICVLPDGRLLVSSGTNGANGLAFVTIYAGVPAHAKELILSPLFN